MTLSIFWWFLMVGVLNNSIDDMNLICVLLAGSNKGSTETRE